MEGMSPTEEQVSQSASWLQAVLEAAADPIIVVNSAGVMITVNKAAEVLFATPRLQLLNHALGDLFPAETERIRSWLTAAFRPEARAQRMELRLLGGVTGLRFLEADASPLGESGTQDGLVCVFRDVTAKKDDERQRLEFLARLTHDLKNPLSVILGYTALLREEVRGQAAPLSGNMLDSIETSALTVQTLMTNYLESVRIEQGRFSLTKVVVDINDLLRQVREKHDTAVTEKLLKVMLTLQEGLPGVEGDVFALTIVLTNLIQNAFLATPERGTVQLTSSRRDGFVVVAVTDGGPLITPEAMPFLFDHYRQGKGEREKAGTRLGLFMIKTLVEAHGGKVEVSSTAETGTCFSVFLPVASGEIASSSSGLDPSSSKSV